MPLIMKPVNIVQQEVKELGQRKANESTLSDEDKLRVSQLLDIAKAKKSLAESKRVRQLRAYKAVSKMHLYVPLIGCCRLPSIAKTN